MASEQELYLHEQLTIAQSKYAYFLLAAAASAIALAVNRSAGEPLSYSQIPLGLAVVCWGLSFYFGCKYLSWVQATIRSNAALVMAQSGRLPPGTPANLRPRPDLIAFALEELRRIAEENSESTGRYAHRQFGLRIAGAICYIICHVLGMALRTPGLL